MTLRSQRSHIWTLFRPRVRHLYAQGRPVISVISYEVNECMKHMLLNDILQLVVLLDNYTTIGPV